MISTMTGCRLLRAALLTVVTIVPLTLGYAAACDREIIRRASVGENLMLSCDGVLCLPPNTYRWYNVTAAATSLLLPATTKRLTVSSNVTTVEEVGGQRYTCQCNSEGGECLSFWILVKPQVKLTISPPVAKLGSSVSIVCTAESYPPANDTSYFHLSSPHGQSLSSTQPASAGTGVVYHIAHVNRSHRGEYGCVVTIDGYSLQSNTVRQNLTVYDPPHIVSVRNFTLSSEPHGVESAVLECEVENREDGLEVWVNWTMGTREVVGEKGCVSRAREHVIVFFLVLHNVTKRDVHLYTCQLFSLYSPNKSEDHKTVELLIADTSMSTGSPKLRPTSEGTRPNPKKGFVKCAVVGAVSFIIAVGITMMAVALIICYKRRQKNMGSNLMSQGSRAQPPDSKRYVRIEMISQRALTKQEPAPQGDQQTSQSGELTTTISETGLCTGDDSTSQVSMQEHAPLSLDGQSSESESLTLTNPMATGSEGKLSCSSETKGSVSSRDVNSGASIEADDVDITLREECHVPAVRPKRTMSLSIKKTGPRTEMERLLSSPYP